MYLNRNAIFDIKFIENKINKMNLTFVDLCKKADLSEDAIFKIFNNKADECLIMNIYKLSDALQCLPGELFLN